MLDGSTKDEDRWSASSYPQWAVIDYGRQMTFTGAKLWTLYARAYNYTIEISDKPDRNFRLAIERTNNTDTKQPFVDTFTALSGRYVRITVNSATWYDGDWISLLELEMERSFGRAITIRARGNCGSEKMLLKVNNQTVKTWNNIASRAQNYTYGNYRGGDIHVSFTNDSTRDCDRNLFIDYIDVGTHRFQTESSARRTGCGNAEWLWCNGHFDFSNRD